MAPIHCSYARFLIKYNIYNIHRWPQAYLTMLYTWDRIQYIYIVYTGTSVHPLGKRFDRSDCVHIQLCTHNIVNHRVLSKGYQVILLFIRWGISVNEMVENIFENFGRASYAGRLFGGLKYVLFWYTISLTIWTVPISEYFKGISKNKNRLTLIFLSTHICINHCRHNTSSLRPSDPKNYTVILFGTVPQVYNRFLSRVNIARGFLQSRVSSSPWNIHI